MTRTVDGLLTCQHRAPGTAQDVRKQDGSLGVIVFRAVLSGAELPLSPFHIHPLRDVDFVAWEDALSDDPDAEFVLYDGLNHLFIESEGPYAGTTSEYNGHGSVDSGVVDDIAGFILNRS